MTGEIYTKKKKKVLSLLNWISKMVYIFKANIYVINEITPFNFKRVILISLCYGYSLYVLLYQRDCFIVCYVYACGWYWPLISLFNLGWKIRIENILTSKLDLLNSFINCPLTDLSIHLKVNRGNLLYGIKCIALSPGQVA